MSPKVKKTIRKQKNSSGKDNSSAWMSTEDSPQDAGLTLNTHKGSSLQASRIGLKGNVTGTPDGAGARELGSSIANASSPGANFTLALEVS